jgi:hypothetical protein
LTGVFVNRLRAAGACLDRELCVPLDHRRASIPRSGRRGRGLGTDDAVAAGLRRPGCEQTMSKDTVQESPRFDIDVFISYAHDDDKVFMTDPGWVSQFHEDFKGLLYDQLGRPPCIWRDNDLTPNEEFERKIFNRLVRAAVFLPVLSRIFINRPYCVRELKAFVENAEKSGATYVDGEDGEKKRIFVVEKLSVDRQSLPAELQGLAGTFKFYDGHETLRPALSSKDSTVRESYYKILNRLSKTVADLVLQMGGSAVAPSGVPVYVAETTSDLKEERDALCDDLRDHGYVVLPDRELPHDVKRYADAVCAYLARAALSVHLVGKEYGFVPEGEKERSNVRLQHELALARGDQDPRFTQVVWLDVAGEARADDIPDERQRAFVEYLRNDERANIRAERLEGDIEGVKTELYDKLASYESQIAAAPGGETAEGNDAQAAPRPQGPPLVYLICTNADRTADHLKALRKLLFERGCEPRLSREGSDAETAAAHLERLAECDAFVIYHGTGSEEWLEDRLQEFSKHLRGRKKPVKAMIVYLAPPARPDKDDVFTHEAQVIRAGSEFAPEMFEPLWAAPVRPRAN